jgi:chromosome partition protein MukE
VRDPAFPAVDLALRRGRHIDREDGDWYAFVTDAQDHLEPLYRRFGCELVTQSDGYFYLLPSGDQLSRRHLTAGEMLVGQTLALQFLDPGTVQAGGVITRDQLLHRLGSLIGDRDLARALEPRRKRFEDERIVHDIIRRRIAEAIRRLATLGFIEIIDVERFRLRSPLLRFADPVRGQDTNVALERLIASGQIVVEELANGTGAEVLEALAEDDVAFDDDDDAEAIE